MKSQNINHNVQVMTSPMCLPNNKKVKEKSKPPPFFVECDDFDEISLRHNSKYREYANC